MARNPELEDLDDEYRALRRNLAIHLLAAIPIVFSFVAARRARREAYAALPPPSLADIGGVEVVGSSEPFCRACEGRGWVRTPFGTDSECLACRGTGKPQFVVKEPAGEADEVEGERPGS